MVRRTGHRVKLEYGLSVDRAERDALEALLAGGGAELNCVDADTTSPTVVISSDAVVPGHRPVLDRDRLLARNR